MGARGRITTVLTAIATLLAVSATVAMAQDDYPPPAPETEASITIQKDAIAPGDIQRIFGEGWEEGSEISATITYPDGSTDQFNAAAAADGTWTLEFRVPADLPDGETTVLVEGEDRATGEMIVLSDTFTIDSSLPITGEGVSRMALSAGVLVLIGIGLVLLARGRRREGATPA